MIKLFNISSFFLVLTIIIVGCAHHKKIQHQKDQAKRTSNPRPVVKAKETSSLPLTNKADSIVAFAKKYIGVKYKYGGDNPSGFDCSGFVCFVYKHNGVKLPRTADAQALLGKEVSVKNMRPGDLVYFKGSDKREKGIGHVGIVVENKNGKIKFISATVSSGIHLDDIDGPYWKERFVMGKRILISK